MGTQNLPRACGIRKAKELSFSGFSADQAAAWGIVNRVFGAKVLMEETLKIANTIAQNAPFAVRQVKGQLMLPKHWISRQDTVLNWKLISSYCQRKIALKGFRRLMKKRKAIFTDE